MPRPEDSEERFRLEMRRCWPRSGRVTRQLSAEPCEIGGPGHTTATNCILYANAASVGGAVYSTAGQPAGDFENCTASHNSPDAFNGYTGILHDSILYFDGNEIVPGPVANPVATYCDIQGGYAGLGNTNVNPQFANTNSYVLSENSPCIDAGDPAPQFYDQAFPPSQGGDRNDMGASRRAWSGSVADLCTNAPVVWVNNQPAAPYQVFTFNQLNPPTITFSNGFPDGHFEYTLDGSNPLEYFTLTQIPLLLTNSAEIRILSWSSDYSSYIVTSPVTVEVLPSYSLTAGAAGGGGVFPTGGTFLSNTIVTLTATNAPGWTFLRWSGNAEVTNNPLAVVVSAPINVQAVFGTPLTASVTGNGSIQANPSLALYPYGSIAQLTALPGTAGSYFHLWGGAAAGDNFSPLDFVVTNASPSVIAIFGGLPANNFTLNLQIAGGGDVARNPLASFYAAGS